MSETTALAPAAPAAGPPDSPALPEAVERALARGDFSQVSAEDRLRYLAAVCKSLGLNPLTQPFMWLTDRKGKMVLYARKDCAEQLRALRNITLEIVARDVVDDCCVVHVRATAPAGKGKRSDEDVGAVSLTGLKGDDRAAAIMKAITKAKRRVTLSICGLGLPDADEPADVIDTAAAERPAPAPAAALAAPPAPAPAEAQASAAAPPVTQESHAERATEAQVEEMRRLIRALGLQTQDWQAVLAKRGVKSGRDLTPSQAQEIIDKMAQKVKDAALAVPNGQLQPLTDGSPPFRGPGF